MFQSESSERLQTAISERNSTVAKLEQEHTKMIAEVIE